MPEDNGAKRLLEILLKAKDGDLASVPPVNAWASVFGIINKDNSGVLKEEQEFDVARRLVQMHQLVIDVENKLKSIEGLEVELFLEPFPRIRNVVRLSVLASSQMGAFINQITSSDITVLKFC